MTPEEFKSIRLALNLGQEELADKLNISLSSVELYERGSRRGKDTRPVTVPADVAINLLGLARALDVDDLLFIVQMGSDYSGTPTAKDIQRLKDIQSKLFTQRILDAMDRVKAK